MSSSRSSRRRCDARTPIGLCTADRRTRRPSPVSNSERRRVSRRLVLARGDTSTGVVAGVRRGSGVDIDADRGDDTVTDED